MDFLFFVSGLLGLGVLLQWCAARFRMPAIVLLLGAGLLLGPVTGWIDPDAAAGPNLRSMIQLAVGFVLFEGGLSLRLREVRKLGATLIALCLGGLAVTLACTTWLAHTVAGFDWATSAVMGSILVVTGPTVIRPMLRHARLKRRPALLLKWEGIVNDPLGALLAVVVLEIAILRVSPGGDHPVPTSIALLILSAGAIGVAAGLCFAAALNRGWIPEHLKTPGIVAVVALVFSGAEALFHEAGLLAVTAMGVVLANVSSPSVESIRHFKEDVTTLLVSVLFLVLSARLEPSDMAIEVGGLMFVGLVLLVVRPLAVWIPLSFSKLTWQERAYVGWIAPRGIVAAAMAATLQPRLIEAGWEDATQLVPTIFGVVLATVVLHGLTAKPLAVRLGLASQSGGGVLVVGTSPWLIDLAGVLKRNEVDVVVVEADFRGVNRARMAGLDVIYGDPLSEDTLDEIPWERLASALTATSEDHYNALVSLSLVKLLGRENVLQVPTAELDEEDGESPLKGRVPWGSSTTFSSLSRRFWGGSRFKSTELTERYGYEQFRVDQPDALVLFAIEDRKLFPIVANAEPEAGMRIVYIP